MMVIRAIVIAVTTGHVDLGGREAREWAGLSVGNVEREPSLSWITTVRDCCERGNDGNSTSVIISHGAVGITSG